MWGSSRLEVVVRELFDHLWAEATIMFEPGIHLVAYVTRTDLPIPSTLQFCISTPTKVTLVTRVQSLVGGEVGVVGGFGVVADGVGDHRVAHHVIIVAEEVGNRKAYRVR